MKFKPLVDKLFWIIFIPTVLLLAGVTSASVFHMDLLFVAIPMDCLVIYFFLSPLFGYVELSDESIYIKYGFIMKKEIPYTSIRGIVRERKFYSDSMMSLKNSFDHVNIKYNSFDVTTVSVIDNDIFVMELQKRIS